MEKLLLCIMLKMVIFLLKNGDMILNYKIKARRKNHREPSLSPDARSRRAEARRFQVKSTCAHTIYNSMIPLPTIGPNFSIRFRATPFVPAKRPINHPPASTSGAASATDNQLPFSVRGSSSPGSSSPAGARTPAQKRAVS